MSRTRAAAVAGAVAVTVAAGAVASQATSYGVGDLLAGRDHVTTAVAGHPASDEQPLHRRVAGTRTPAHQPAARSPRAPGTGQAPVTPPRAPASPAPLLSEGDTGPSVRELQARLRQIAWFSGDVTDYYGDLTEAAVAGFQAKRGFPSTGAVD